MAQGRCQRRPIPTLRAPGARGSRCQKGWGTQGTNAQGSFWGMLAPPLSCHTPGHLALTSPSVAFLLQGALPRGRRVLPLGRVFLAPTRPRSSGTGAAALGRTDFDGVHSGDPLNHLTTIAGALPPVTLDLMEGWCLSLFYR